MKYNFIVKEQYVNPATAIKLETVGFPDIPTRYVVVKKDTTFLVNGSVEVFYKKYDIVDRSYTFEKGSVPLPTQEMVMQWLRGVHHLHIETSYSHKEKYYSTVHNIKTNKLRFPNDSQEDFGVHFFAKYEDCVEYAINFCIDRLIDKKDEESL